MKIKVLDFGYESLPKRAHANDAGADVHAHIIGSEGQSGTITIAPNTTVKIPLGLGLVLPDGYAAFVFPRSGLSSKGITCELPPIDSGYRGEIHAIITNCSTKAVVVHDGDRIGQLLIMPIVIADFITDDFEQRGTGAFGSTGV